MMNVIAVQARATIQDLGRYGLRKYGIGHSGVMDGLALRAGNLLLGNEENAPAVEIPLGSLSVYFDEDTAFCITGALYEAYLEDEPVYSYWRYNAKAGQILRLVRARAGMYGYLCVPGGFDVEKELSSRSTDLRTKIGGLEGRCLQPGDRIATFGYGRTLPLLGISAVPFGNVLHAVPSSEYGAFQRKSQYYFWRKCWTLQSNSDRMGYRFNGESLKLKRPLEMLSHAIQFGTVQVPPDGKPIILMADAQTTGGYPKIACVIAADLGRLAQSRFGSQIRFKPVSLEEAYELRRKNEVYLNQIRRIVHENRS